MIHNFAVCSHVDEKKNELLEEKFHNLFHISLKIYVYMCIYLRELFSKNSFLASV